MKLVGKVAVITGAARGIGAAIAQYLSNEGAYVVIADINYEAAIDFSNKLESMGRGVIPAYVNVIDEVSIVDMVNKVLEKYKKIDILVNNAGVNNNKPIPELELGEWERILHINLTGTFLCSKIVLVEMMKNRCGRIVNVASMAGQIGGLKVSPDYTAAKAGVIGLTKSFARFGAKYGINVNTVSPGFIETEMTRGRDDPSSVPLGRLGTPEDIAKAVYFLTSDLSDFITGATIDINGGMLMR